MSSRSAALVLVGVLVQAGVGLWLANAGETPAGDLITTFAGAGIIVLAAAAFLLALPALVLFRVGRIEIVGVVLLLAIAIAFAALGAGTPLVWPLPLFYLGAAISGWRGRSAAT